MVLIDDDPHLRQALSQTLDLAGLEVASLGDARDLAARLPAEWQGVIVSDIRMPGIDGLELLQQLRARDSELPVILITGHGDIQLAVQAMRAGAYDFLEKPFPSEALLDSVRRALALRQLVLDNRSLRLALADRQQLSARLLGQSRAMLRLREQIGALAGTQADVLILGETGAGKEVVARALHDLSNRRNDPFVAINAGALAESVRGVDERTRAGLPPGSVVEATGMHRSSWVREAETRGVLVRHPMFTAVEPDGVRMPDGSFEPADVILWATGFRPALSPIRGIPRDTPGLFVLGFDNINGPGAGTIGGVGPFARDIARQITGRRQ